MSKRRFFPTKHSKNSKGEKGTLNFDCFVCLVGNHSCPFFSVARDEAALSSAWGAPRNPTRLDHINCDLGNLVLTQLGPHFMLQMRRVHSIWKVQQKYHASLILVK